MRKILFSLLGFVLLVPPLAAQASVTASASSLVLSGVNIKANSGQYGLFALTLGQNAGETLSSVAVTISNNGSSTATGSDFASISVYKDNGNGVFDPAVDAVSGTQSAVNIGSSTIVTTQNNNTLNGGKFFVSFATSAAWSSSSSPVDSVIVHLPVGAVVTSANSPVISSTTTAAIIADTVSPVLTQAVSKNTGSTTNKEAGDSIELTFSEKTNKFAVSAANIAGLLQLNNSHSFLDGLSSIGGAAWNADGNKLTLTLSGGTSLPTVVVGDVVTTAGSSITDLSGNAAMGSVAITGNFGGSSTGAGGDDDDNDEDSRRACAGGVVNGKLYKVKGSTTVYLVAGCRFKPFRGAAVFRARGHKFMHITELDKLPDGVVVSARPALPAEGTLVKGDKDKTVWFVSKDGKRRGFTREQVFRRLGFRFDRVEIISQSDLDTMEVGIHIDSETEHPDGTVVKCENATVVFQVKGRARHPFTSVDAFNSKGHAFKHILSIDCGKFTYEQGSSID